ncbi:MAG: mechanosensitive ion channel domain-containing protein [Spirochaetota bacterium]
MGQIIPKDLTKYLNTATLFTVLRIILILVVSYLVLKLLVFLFGKLLLRRFSEQSKMVLKKVLLYSGVTIIAMIVLAQLGLSLAALLGAAGIAGIAIGFAAQTSFSNIISGLFLISEKSFTIGDIIKVGDINGIVMTIDLLSVKIRTFDNQFIRIPNETLIKSEVTNVTRFPIRRLDINITVDYKTNLAGLKDTLMNIAVKNPYCFGDPEPLFVIKDFGTVGIEILFGVWFAKENYLQLKNSIMENIKAAFAENEIEIPVPILLKDGTHIQG